MLRAVELKKEESLKKINARFQQRLNMLCSPVKNSGANLGEFFENAKIH